MKPSFPQQIDNTIRSAWKACRRKALLQNFIGWQPRGPESVHLHAGGAFARGLEVTRKAFYGDGLDADDAIGLGWAALQAAYQVDYDSASLGRSAKTPDRMGAALVDYFDTYPLATDWIKPAFRQDGAPAVEFTFAIPLPLVSPETGEPILYTGRFDMLGQSGDKFFVVDEKTSGSLGEYWARRYELSAQFTGYCWAARTFGFPVVGALIRGIGILKTELKHAEMPLYRPDWMIAEWYHELVQEVGEMIDAWRALDDDMANQWHPLIFNPDYNEACGAYGGCKYQPVCKTAPIGREKLLEANYEKRLWVPLHGAEYDE